jgi:hypothetical protein
MNKFKRFFPKNLLLLVMVCLLPMVDFALATRSGENFLPLVVRLPAACMNDSLKVYSTSPFSTSEMLRSATNPNEFTLEWVAGVRMLSIRCGDEINLNKSDIEVRIPASPWRREKRLSIESMTECIISEEGSGVRHYDVISKPYSRFSTAWSSRRCVNWCGDLSAMACSVLRWSAFLAVMVTFCVGIGVRRQTQ